MMATAGPDICHHNTIEHNAHIHPPRPFLGACTRRTKLIRSGSLVLNDGVMINNILLSATSKVLNVCTNKQKLLRMLRRQRYTQQIIWLYEGCGSGCCCSYVWSVIFENGRVWFVCFDLLWFDDWWFGNWYKFSVFSEFLILSHSNTFPQTRCEIRQRNPHRLNSRLPRRNIWDCFFKNTNL